jgi:hypothetical protein
MYFKIKTSINGTDEATVKNINPKASNGSFGTLAFQTIIPKIDPKNKSTERVKRTCIKRRSIFKSTYVEILKYCHDFTPR